MYAPLLPVRGCVCRSETHVCREFFLLYCEGLSYSTGHLCVSDRAWSSLHRLQSMRSMTKYTHWRCFHKYEQLCDEMEDTMVEGGNIVDFHSCNFFPERWFHLVIVLRVDNSILYPRLEKRYVCVFAWMDRNARMCVWIHIYVQAYTRIRSFTLSAFILPLPQHFVLHSTLSLYIFVYVF